MTDDTIDYWTRDEFSAGLCKLEEIGNPKGKQVEARRLAQTATIKAMKALVEVTEQNEDLGAKVKAAQMILDRGWGKPDQHISSDSVNTNWYMTPDWMAPTRLSYQIGMEHTADITDVKKLNERDGYWLAALAIAVEKNPDDKHARQALTEARARVEALPVLPPPEAK